MQRIFFYTFRYYVFWRNNLIKCLKGMSKKWKRQHRCNNVFSLLIWVAIKTQKYRLLTLETHAQKRNNKNWFSSTSRVLYWYIEQTKILRYLCELVVVTSKNFAFHLQLSFDCVWRSQVIYNCSVHIVENWNRRQF